MVKIVIRDANPDDSNIILGFIKELAIYEKALDEVVTDEVSIRETLFAVDSSTKAVICEKEGNPIAFAVYFFNYSTWLGKRGLYLEDLYVSLSERGSGIGKTLLKHLANIAVANNCGRFEWSVLDWNQPAIDFYESFGAEAQPEWIGYRLSGDALTDFAK